MRREKCGADRQILKDSNVSGAKISRAVNFGDAGGVVDRVTWLLQMKESHRVSSQNALAVGGRKVELIEDRRRIIDVLGGEMIRPSP